MWKRMSMKRKLIVPYIVLMVVFSVSIYFFVSLKVIKPLIMDKLAADHSIGYSLMDNKYPGDWSVKDEKLYKGERIIEGEAIVVDEIKRRTNSVATVFRGNTRVATCVLKEDGNRAVGTKVAPEVEAAVLRGGNDFIGTAKVVGKPYQTKYSPIRDRAGTIIGMWFVGVDKEKIASFDIMMGIFVAIFMIMGVAIPYWTSTTITRKIKSAMDQMHETADQVATAANQVSSSSQLLAEGASAQASAIEETSSSLEEMSSMTRQNAENANHANSLMGETKNTVERADGSMKQLTSSMKEISGASEETSKIVKTIDEIAFQTNLLALNAAVEAARAGEAGAGFAVVANEVRNLAMRAAEAAKNTSVLIEGIVRKIKEGSAIVEKTNGEFVEMSRSAGKSAELVGEISAASNEQAQGVSQISKAITDMDKVVQQNAATAEESASASEQMNAQAQSMKGVIREISQIVGGNNHVKAAAGMRMMTSDMEFTGGHRQVLRGDAGRQKIACPDKVMPVQESDFKDF